MRENGAFIFATVSRPRDLSELAGLYQHLTRIRLLVSAPRERLAEYRGRMAHSRFGATLREICVVDRNQLRTNRLPPFG